MSKDQKNYRQSLPKPEPPIPSSDDQKDEPIPVPPGELPPDPIQDPPLPGQQAPIDEGPKEPKMYV
jgi:hypothetical protein